MAVYFWTSSVPGVSFIWLKCLDPGGPEDISFLNHLSFTFFPGLGGGNSIVFILTPTVDGRNPKQPPGM